MTNSNYIKGAKAVVDIIDIAIESINKYPPVGFNNIQLNQFINTYIQFKNSALNPLPKYANLRSLAYIKRDALTYFQEGTGDAVTYFWKQVDGQNLGVRRENKLQKILKRGKIKDKMEYNFVTDVLVPYQQTGLITDDDVSKINQMIASFEK